MPAAQEKHSKPGPLKFVSPPKPFQRPTGTKASNSMSSAIWQSSSVFGQLTFSVPSTVEMAHPPPRLVENVPSLSLRLLKRGLVENPSALCLASVDVDIFLPSKFALWPAPCFPQMRFVPSCL